MYLFKKSVDIVDKPPQNQSPCLLDLSTKNVDMVDKKEVKQQSDRAKNYKQTGLWEKKGESTKCLQVYKEKEVKIKWQEERN